MKQSRIIAIFSGALLMFVINASFIAQNIPPNPSSTLAPPVRLSLIVTDKSDHSLDEIRKEDIKVFEGNVEQTILLLERDQRPVDLGIAVDSSGSFKELIGSALSAVQIIIHRKRPSDEVFIERFTSGDKIETVQDFTSDESLLLAGLKLMRVEGGQSAVIDALYLAVDHTAKHEPKEHRKAVIFITDGEDRASYYKREDLIKFLHTTNVQVFVIGIVTLLDSQAGLVRSSPREVAEGFLRSVAEESGGRLFLPKNVGELSRALDEIDHDLKSQFVIGYQSTNDGGKTGFRKVDVKAIEAPGREKLHLITARGYYLKPPSSDSKSKDKKPQ
ncbi:MAG TPA: VWA domain-containing protein [Pyrinomonadaceae bacterium]|nr:VWA domain-containing protein [Pyrinomonadaceae bacterium]